MKLREIAGRIAGAFRRTFGRQREDVTHTLDHAKPVPAVELPVRGGARHAYGKKDRYHPMSWRLRGRWAEIAKVRG